MNGWVGWEGPCLFVPGGGVATHVGGTGPGGCRRYCAGCVRDFWHACCSLCWHGRVAAAVPTGVPLGTPFLAVYIESLLVFSAAGRPYCVTHCCLSTPAGAPPAGGGHPCRHPGRQHRLGGAAGGVRPANHHQPPDPGHHLQGAGGGGGGGGGPRRPTTAGRVAAPPPPWLLGTGQHIMTQYGWGAMPAHPFTCHATRRRSQHLAALGPHPSSCRFAVRHPRSSQHLAGATHPSSCRCCSSPLRSCLPRGRCAPAWTGWTRTACWHGWWWTRRTAYRSGGMVSRGLGVVGRLGHGEPGSGWWGGG